MIAKVINNSGSSSSATFGRIAKYITDEKQGGDKADWVDYTNFVANDENAVFEARAIQDLNSRAKHKSMHFVISFPNGERPEKEVIKDAEEQAIKALGFDDHQRISALHSNTDHVHLHVLVNMINPDNLKANNPSYSHMKLDRVMGQLEQKHSLIQDNRSQAVESTVRKQDRLSAHSRDSFKSYVLKNAARELLVSFNSDNRSWKSLHETAAKYDLQIKKEGAGLIIVPKGDLSGNLKIKASEVDRSFSRSKLEASLGKFNSSNHSKVKAELSLIDQPVELQVDSELAEMEQVNEPLKQSHQEGKPKQDNHRVNNKTDIKSDKAKSLESHRGVSSFHTWAKDEAGPAILKEAFRSGANWQSLQDKAGEYGLRFEKRGAGLVIINNDNKLTIKPSDISRELSKSNLEAQLGKFVSVKQNTSPEYQYSPKPLESTGNSLYDKFQAERRRNQQLRQNQLSIAKQQNAANKQQIYQLSKAWRSHATGQQRYAQRDKRNQARAERLAKLAENYKSKRSEIIDRYPMPSWKAWLAQQARSGDKEAAAIVEKNAKRKIRLATLLNSALPDTDLEKMEYELRNDGELHFKLESGARLSDDGHSLHLLPTSEAITDQALLQSMLLATKQGHQLVIDTQDKELGNRMALIAAQHQLAARFTDEHTNSVYNSHKAASVSSVSKQSEQRRDQSRNHEEGQTL